MLYKDFKKINKANPDIGKLIEQYKTPILTDFKKIKMVAEIYGRYHHIKFPADIHKVVKHKRVIPVRTGSQHVIKFLTLCLFIFDPEVINGLYIKRMRPYMRSTISDFTKTNPSLISQYLPRARVYMKVYPTFIFEVQQMIAIVKSEIKK